MLLDRPGGRVVLAEGGLITAHHLRRDRDYGTVVGTVEAHPAGRGRIAGRQRRAPRGGAPARERHRG
jgi:hypothetical protein